MKESYWKRGSKEDAEKISEAFRDLGACTCADYTNEDILYVLDGICGTLFMLPYESQTAEAIMDSHMFNELTLKVEPKIKVGDWVVFNNSHNSIYQISEIRDSYYMLTHTHGGSMSLSFSQGELIRPWTIEDAKAGDVLMTEDYIFIFKYILHGGVHLYCHYDIDDEEFDAYISDAVIGNIHDKGAHFQPATKEQRDLLFRKMKEAGYEWDEKKKELRKIIKPKFKVGDRIQFGTRNVLTINQVDFEKQQYIVGNKDVLRMTIPFREQSNYEVVNIPEPKFEVDDLVVLDDLLGRITDSKYEDGMWLYRVGCRNTWNFDYELMKADHRDEHRILKGGGL